MSSLERTARSLAKVAFAGLDLFGSSWSGPRILIYHQVGATLGREMEVSTGAFRRHVDHLSARFRLTDLTDALASDEGEPDPAVITFDDGYRDMYTNAYPLLLDRGIPFVLYVCTEMIETGVSIGPQAGAEPLTWDEIGRMQESGLVTIGAHTHTHADLREASRSAVQDEIGVSNELIRDRLGVEPRHFAYPWGYWGEAAHDVVAETYETATLGGHPVIATHDLLKVNRIPVQLSDGVWGFKSKMRSGGRNEERLRRRLTGYYGP